MATYKFNAVIYVQDVKSKQQAINALQTALDAYEDVNPGEATIVIHHDEPALTKENPD